MIKALLKFFGPDWEELEQDTEQTLLLYKELEEAAARRRSEVKAEETKKKKAAFLQDAALKAIAGMSNKEFFEFLGNNRPGMETMAMAQLIGTTAAAIAISAWEELQEEGE